MKLVTKPFHFCAIQPIAQRVGIQEARGELLLAIGAARRKNKPRAIA
jgi:hypothetical protein